MRICRGKEDIRRTSGNTQVPNSRKSSFLMFNGGLDASTPCGCLVRLSELEKEVPKQHTLVPNILVKQFVIQARN